MKRNVIIIAVVTALAIVLWIRHSRTNVKNTAGNTPAVNAVQDSHGHSAQPANPGKNSSSVGTSAVGQGPSSPFQTTSDSLAQVQAKAALREMNMILADAAKGAKDFDEVVKTLKDSGQNPVVTRDGNPYTGDMLVIRTSSPIPGTRYFHAQYVKEKNGKPSLQHMSFEFKPGPTALNDAIQSAQQTFSVGKAPYQKADFSQWDLDDTYVLWIKKKALKDLQDDPFNGYDPVKDLGTVQVAVEQKIHEDAKDTKHEH